MIVCICNALRDSDLKANAACNGGTCAESLMASMGCSPQCGQCLNYIDEFITTPRGSLSGPTAPAGA